MLNRKELDNYKRNDMCKLARKQDYHDMLSTYLINKGDIFFENYQPYLKLNDHYAAITDENVLCSAVRRHIAPNVRHKVNNKLILDIIECISDTERLQVDLEIARTQNKHLINFNNGIYDIINQELKPHDIKYCFDYRLAADYISPDKRNLKEYNYFIDSSIGKENEKSMLTTIGVAASSIRDIKKMVIIIGDGDSGKSKICDIIERGVGNEYIVTNAVDKIGSEKAIASYAGGKRVNLSRDTTIGTIKEDAGFKSVISCEPVNGRLLYHNEISVTPRVFCVAASNEFPKFKNADDATLNRLIIVKIKGYDGKPNPKFSERLLSEADSIISLAVDNLNNFINSDYDFNMSEESKKVLEQEKKKIHMIESFVNDCCEIDENGTISSVELQRNYLYWCDINAIEPIGKNTFFDKVKYNIKGIVYKKVPYGNSYVNGFHGIKLKTSMSNESNDNCNKISKGNDHDIKVANVT